MSKNHTMQDIARKQANDEKLSFKERNILKIVEKKKKQAGLTPETIQGLQHKFIVTYNRK